MKTGLIVLMAAGPALLLAACVAPVAESSAAYYARNRDGSTPAPASSSRSAAELGVSSGAAAASASSLPPPDAELLYERSSRDAFGTRSYSSHTQVRGPVVHERQIGNMPVEVNGMPQSGYVPAGTPMIFDPATGRWLPVRRR